MEQLHIAELVEKYLKSELNPEEKAQFEELRKSNPEVDQTVVEYHFFLEEMERYGQVRRFKSNLYDTHHTLQENADIKDLQLKTGAKIINLWSKYRRVVAVAASIAGITALFISGMVSLFSPNAPIRDLEELRRKVSNLEKQSTKQITEFNKIKTKIEPGADVKFGGTSFMVDPNGFLVTSAHVLKGAVKVYVQNVEGKDFLAEVVHKDLESDIALLKINDADFSATTSLPYGFSRKKTDLSEPVFTLGFPKDEIVYNEGYLSAQTGLEGDTMSCQITITANPGNSGGPVFNKNGEVIGILNARQASAKGVVFATKSKNIYRLVESLKETEKDLNIRMKETSALKGSNRSTQVKKVQDHIYMVKVVLG
ncbi:MAG: trypsin-like peptidase domain-containing protein [Bacteroidetes bacterium]|nr:trypsin-like peptidase domain-containing protein [Bacteroidota bacterium]